MIEVPFFNGKPTFIIDPRGLPRNPPDCIIWDSWVFDSFILADELFANMYKDLKFFY